MKTITFFMKTISFYSFLPLVFLAALALAGTMHPAQAQTASDVYGEITIRVAGAPSAGASRFSAVSPTLVNRAELRRNVLSSTAGSLTLEGTAPMSPGSFDESSFGEPRYYVEITTGDFAGAWTDILSNTADTLTTSDDLTPFLDSDGNPATLDAATIRKHVTIAEFLGPNNEAGLGVDPGMASGDEVIVFESGTAGTTKLFFFPEIPELAPGVGNYWVDSSYNNRNEMPIPPHQGLFIKRKQVGDITFKRSGYVKTGPTLLKIEEGPNFMGLVHPIGEDDAQNPVFTLGSSTLADVLGSGGTILEADNVVLFREDGTTNTFFHVPPFLGGTWVNDSFENADDVVLEEGTAIYVRRKSAATNWVVPPVAIAAP